MKLAIIANPEKYSVKAPFIEILQWADTQNVKILFSKQLKEFYEEDFYTSAKETATEQEAVEEADVVITIGGDGSMLYAAGLLRGTDKPILGVNSGRLGFLANTQQEQLVDALNHLIEENYDIKNRYLLKAENENGDKYYALNEFLFAKKIPRL